ncbi:MAG TPA: toll/interleukin-1 receptor domain-containing protein, partial [Ktedonobacteraceae bacterium]|nr:toll/interleukin-1 receptor domain-containing protein [Ktedonobacteraceae bacterium]
QIADALKGLESGVHIVKLYGHTQNEQTSFPPRFSSTIQTSLQHYFNRDIIIVGCMEEEKDAISALHFHEKGGMYYVRQNRPAPDDIVVKCLDKQGKQLDDFLIAGNYGKFDTFFCTLEKSIKERILGGPTSSSIKASSTVPLSSLLATEANGEDGASNISPMGSPPWRISAFISYSHKDLKYLSELRVHLTLYERMGMINSWDDTKIQPGAKWREEINKALQSAKVAILLISADFLASDFIATNELPPLLVAAEKEGATILPVILRPCLFMDTDLAQFQTVNVPSNPLSRMAPGRRDEVWSRVAELVRDALKTQG